MIKRLKLRNFGKHVELELYFTAGLNVIRAANEAGKSTLFVGIGYLLWGARALPMSLAETVTWGVPESQLGAEGDLTVAGVDYLIRRSKSGAELKGPDLLVSGHAEVTAFVEKLLGASMSTGLATLMSMQSGLKDSLDSSSVSLIEKLSNMGVIDTLISRVQERLPCGNTKLLEQAIALDSQLKRPEADFSTLEGRLAGATELAEVEAGRLVATEQAYAEAQEAAKPAMELIGAQQQIRRQLAKTEVPADVLPPVLETITENVNDLLVKKQAQDEAAALHREYAVFKSLRAPARLDSPSEASANLVFCTKKLEKLEAEIKQAEREHATLLATKITQTSCGLCGKDLANIPEVVAANEAIDEKASKVATYLGFLCEDRSQMLVDVSNLKKALDANSVNSTLIKQLKHVSVWEGTTPVTVTWTGGELPAIDTTDYASAISAVQTQERANATKVAAYEKAVSRAQELQRLQASLESQLVSTDEAQALVAAATAASTALSEARKVATLRQGEKVAADRALAEAKAAHAMAVATFEAQMQALEQSKQMLQVYNKNNGILKKLREAKPAVSRKLWALVTGGISSIFSQIRGVPSIVTRTDDAWQIDGKSVKLYSGSTKDSLGLAIRMMLQKTFMPHADFTLLDEVAAACDSQREVEMIATVTRTDFKQVILVTHSDLADTYAANIVTL